MLGFRTSFDVKVSCVREPRLELYRLLTAHPVHALVAAYNPVQISTPVSSTLTVMPDRLQQDRAKEMLVARKVLYECPQCCGSWLVQREPSTYIFALSSRAGGFSVSPDYLAADIRMQPSRVCSVPTYIEHHIYLASRKLTFSPRLRYVCTVLYKLN